MRIVKITLISILALANILIPSNSVLAEKEMLQAPSEIWSFGYNDSGVNGLGTTTGSVVVPTQTGSSEEWALVSAGDHHSLAIKANGTLWSFGSNSSGRTGLGTGSDFVDVPTQVGDGSDWLVAAAGSYHSLALKEDGTLWSFGWNDGGLTGLGVTSGDTLVPTQVGVADDWSALAVGYSHSLALKEDGTLWSFGSNSYGQTGLGTDSGNTTVPTQVGTDDDWSAISAGTYLSLALKEDGTLWSFGSNSDGQTGLGTDSGNTTVPTQVGTDDDWSDISAGSFFSLVRKENGTLWSFGANANGRTGLGTTDGTTISPAQVGSSVDWAVISAGNRQALALKTDGTLWSFGGNDFGQAGLGASADNIVSPTQVGIGTDWRTVTAGAYHSLALREIGVLPSISTSLSDSISASSVILKGEVTALGTRVVTSWGFNYGTTGSYGESKIVEGSLGLGSFESTITGLQCGTTYHFQAFADTESTSSMGSDRSIFTPSCFSGKGTTVQQRVKNLRKIGNSAEADKLVQEWSYLFASTSTTPMSTTSSSASIEPQVRNLEISMQGEDVRLLQQLLIKINTGPSSVELQRVGATGYFGQYTQNALSEYQRLNGIVPSIGYFGPITRAQMKVYGLGELWW